MEAEQFRDLVACQDDQQICDYLQISQRTLSRWKSGAAAPPHSAIIALRLRLHCDFGALHPGWQGWRIEGGKLHTPGYFKRPFAPEQILGMFFNVQELASLRRELASLRRELASLRRELARLNRESVESRRTTWAAQQVRKITSLIN